MKYTFLILVCFFSIVAHAQEQRPNTIITPEVIDEKIVADSIPEAMNPETTFEEQPLKRKKRTYKGPISMFAGNPGRAALYSLVIPGGGQYYNKKYFKIPIVWAVEGVAIGTLVYNARQFNRWDAALEDRIAGVANPLSDGRTIAEVLSAKNTVRRNRDYSIVATAIIHLIQVADAFVHRHLIEFDVSDDLSLDVGTPYQPLSVGITYAF